MTPRQAREIARSLRFRRQLWQDVPEMESQLKNYVRQNADLSQKGKKVARLDNFKVVLEDGLLDIEYMSTSIPESQKEFEFLQEVKSGN